MKSTSFVLILLGVLIGIAGGLALYTFVYARGYSYLSNNPAACANCHAMRDVYDGWMKSSHHAAATCNDCHTPANPVLKYATKTSNGFFHSFAFTTGRFPDAIQIKDRNLEVTESACRNCHEDMVTGIDSVHRGSGEASCVRCHSSVGHMEQTSTAFVEDKP